MDYSRNEGTDYIKSLSYSPSLAVVSFLALVLAPFFFISLFVFGLSSWISPYTSASAGESLDFMGEEGIIEGIPGLTVHSCSKIQIEWT